jgi:NAD(P)-dependent dehydrogenase (short-subunit alcohol dehydrogenase family)
MGLLSGKVAIVTGASRGIGEATARVFALEGASVVLAARSAAEIDRVAAEINSAGGAAVAVAADLTDQASAEHMVASAVERFGRLDVAFNNAGSGHMPHPLGEISASEFDYTIRANLLTVFLSMRAELAAMLAGGGGAILNMSSTAGLQGAPGMGAYAAAKHGVIGLTKAAALDYGRLNIRVNAIAPGPIVKDAIPEAARERIARAVPMGKLGTGDEVAHAAAWLCSDQASFVSGAVLSVDGGRLAGVPS